MLTMGNSLFHFFQTAAQIAEEQARAAAARKAQQKKTLSGKFGSQRLGAFAARLGKSFKGKIKPDDDADNQGAGPGDASMGRRTSNAAMFSKMTPTPKMQNGQATAYAGKSATAKERAAKAKAAKKERARLRGGKEGGGGCCVQ